MPLRFKRSVRGHRANRWSVGGLQSGAGQMVLGLQVPRLSPAKVLGRIWLVLPGGLLGFRGTHRWASRLGRGLQVGACTSPF